MMATKPLAFPFVMRCVGWLIKAQQLPTKHIQMWTLISAGFSTKIIWMPTLFSHEESCLTVWFLAWVGLWTLLFDFLLPWRATRYPPWFAFCSGVVAWCLTMMHVACAMRVVVTLVSSWSKKLRRAARAVVVLGSRHTKIRHDRQPFLFLFMWERIHDSIFHQIYLSTNSCVNLK